MLLCNQLWHQIHVHKSSPKTTTTSRIIRISKIIQKMTIYKKIFRYYTFFRYVAIGMTTLCHTEDWVRRGWSLSLTKDNFFRLYWLHKGTLLCQQRACSMQGSYTRLLKDTKCCHVTFARDSTYVLPRNSKFLSCLSISLRISIADPQNAYNHFAIQHDPASILSVVQACLFP